MAQILTAGITLILYIVKGRRAAAYQLGNTRFRTITEVKQR